MIIIPTHLKGKELTTFLMENKAALVQQKKSLPIKHSEPISCNSFVISAPDTVVKAAGEAAPQDNKKRCRVKVVCNTAYWVDSQLDVAIPGCYDKTIRERGHMIVHLHDHIHTLEAKIGDVTSVYTQNIALTELGINKAGSVQCMVMESDVRHDYNEKIYNMYANGGVSQHSIGLQYVRLSLAINDPDAKEEYAVWEKYIDKIINNEVAKQYGFFWAMEEIKVLENSAVLFGSNELTPTLGASTKTEPSDDTPPAPQVEQQTEKFDISNAIKNFKLSD